MPLFVVQHFLAIVGIIEMVAGAIVLNPAWTRFGAYLVAAWIGLIIVDLYTIGDMYDIILRDIAIAVGYVTFGVLTELKEEATQP